MAYGTKAILQGFAGTNTADAHKFSSRVVIGATSTVTSQVGNDMKITKTGTGAYKAQLVGSYGRILDHHFGWINASGVVLDVCIVDETTLPTSGYFTFETRAKAGSATAATSGDVLFVTVWVSDNLTNKSR